VTIEPVVEFGRRALPWIADGVLDRRGDVGHGEAQPNDDDVHKEFRLAGEA